MTKDNREHKKAVVIGGGTGLSTILRGLKVVSSLDLTAIVTVGDDGGSSGILREELKMPPPGDIRNVLVALAEKEPLLQSLFQHRFQHGDQLSGHSLGNLLIAGMKEITGDFVTAVKALSRVLAVRGTVLPAANQSIKLTAHMDDGSIVSGESNIPKANKRIERLKLEPPDIEALPEALQAIEEADIVLIGPGSLYTSIIPNLLVPGIQTALKETSADIIYIANVMTQPGETDNYDVKDHIDAIYRHVSFPLFQKAIVNTGLIPPEVVERYKLEGASPVTYQPNSLADKHIEVIEDTLYQMNNYVRHDAQRLKEIVLHCLYGHGYRK
ncbi:gluconeogenesis factor YvcK family protein [Caldalkalibacillus salinus]|uniref:gluconeogenesis factor YvcK family protein n=1 Tax=Caldalkalibacillus salinus TaxID=2803787 RepID=UPI00192053A4|nr:YvcK family protein [Caldalkalibacillus salinus]